MLVTDSSACLPPALFYSPHVRVVPIRILLPNGYLKESPEATEAIYRALAAGEALGSAPPTLADYLAGIEEGAFEEALVLTPATELSGMYRLASMASSLSDRPVEVVDTRSIAAGQYLVACAALEALAAGAEAAETAGVARDAASRTELVAALPQLGSLPRLAEIALAESAPERGRHPLVRVRDGDLSPLAHPALGGGLDKLAAAWRASGGPRAESTVVFHSVSEPRALELCSLLGTEPEIVPFSPSLALQLGSGCVGLAWRRRSGV